MYLKNNDEEYGFFMLENSGEEYEMHHINSITLMTHLCKGLKSSSNGKQRCTFSMDSQYKGF